MNLYQPTITGSLSVSGSINISGSINVVGGGGTITGTASYATNAELLDGLDSTVFTLTSSFAAFTASQNILNGTYATTGSNTFKNPQTINSNLTVTGSITAQTLIVSTINATQSYSSGSNIFGNASSNTQTFTGSVNITGSLTVVTTGTEFQVTNTGVKFGNVITDAHSITGSISLSGSISTTGSATFTSADLATDGLGNVNIFTTDAAATGRGGSLAFGGGTTGGTSPYAFAKIEGIYDGTAAYNGAMLFSTNNGGTITERMRIGSGGKVGISTSVAGDVLLNVVNGSSTGYGMNISAGSGSGNYALRVENYNGASTLLYVRGDGNILINDTSANSYAKLQVTATSGVVLGLANPSAASADTGNVIQAWGTSGYNTLGEIDFLWDGATTTYAYMAFKTRGPSLIERMRITSAGDVLMGGITSTYGGKLNILQYTADSPAIFATNNTASPYGIRVKHDTVKNNTDYWFYYAGEGSSGRFYVSSNGGVNNYSGNNSNLSDERVKKDVVALESYWNKFKNIGIVKFKYKDQTHDDYNIGVIAQQVESIAPEFVNTDGFGETPEDGIPLKSIYTEDLHTATIKVLQEAMARIETLETEITELKIK